MGFLHHFREQSLGIDGQALEYLAMENTKSIDGVRHAEKAKSVDRRQLEAQGEALEAVENTYGIWKSVKLNKHALVYSMTNSCSVSVDAADSAIVLAAYLCAATYVSCP
jgi:hypothetical protein